MEGIKSISAKFQSQFDEHKLFRRLLMLFICFMTYLVTVWAFEFANNNAEHVDGLQIAAIITAVHAPITALTGYLSKLYWEKCK